MKPITINYHISRLPLSFVWYILVNQIIGKNSTMATNRNFTVSKVTIPYHQISKILHNNHNFPCAQSLIEGSVRYKKWPNSSFDPSFIKFYSDVNHTIRFLCLTKPSSVYAMEKNVVTNFYCIFLLLFITCIATNLVIVQSCLNHGTKITNSDGKYGLIIFGWLP